jgi:membrane protease YdiL (CAAX protease family)
VARGPNPRSYDVRTGQATGVQIVVLIFAVALLGVPASSYVAQVLGGTKGEAALIGQGLPLVAGALVLFGFPKLRAFALEELSRPIPLDRRAEVAGVAVAKAFVLFGFIGAFALWAWIHGGGDAVAVALKSESAEMALQEAYSTVGLLHRLLLASIVAPFVEELVFRGLLYRAWEKRWGGFTAAVLSSALFAAYHPHFFAAFTAAIIFVCLVRRTGTLWSSILVHSFSNLVLWYPLLGRFMLPGADKPSGDLSAWSFQLACLAFAAVAVPLYAWLAFRRPHAVSS